MMVDADAACPAFARQPSTINRHTFFNTAPVLALVAIFA